MSGYLQDKLWIRPVASWYTPAQIRQYLTTVGFKPLPGEEEIKAKEFPRSVETVESLIRHHLLAFPFENTAIHYTATHTVDVSPQGAFDRLVAEGKGKGSYCFGHNTLFLGILRGLGFRAYSIAARGNRIWREVDKPAEYGSHSHMAILIQPYDNDNRTWLVDVGWGGGTLIRPVPLLHGDESVVMGVGPTEYHRLTKVPIPQSSLSSSLESDHPSGQEQWALQVWRGKKADIGNQMKGPWRIFFSFSEQEYFLADYADASFAVSQSPKGLLVDDVICVKYESDEDGYLHTLILFANQVKRQNQGKTDILQTLTSEKEKLKVLREVFGVQIEDDAIAIEYIKGRVSALPQ